MISGFVSTYSDNTTDILYGGDGNDVLTGNGSAILNGGSGNDTLSGVATRFGGNALQGGTGNDTYILLPYDAATLDHITEDINSGIDTVIVEEEVSSYTLDSNVENLILKVGSNGTGNELDNTMTGDASNNSLAGVSGNDTLIGGDGDDTLLGGNGNDRLIGGKGSDILIGGAGNDILSLGAIDTLLDGGTGTDTLSIDGSGTIFFNQFATNKFASFEIIDITGTGNNSLFIAIENVLDLSDTTDRLIINGNSGDKVTSTGQGWEFGGTTTLDGVLYRQYTVDGSIGAATLLVDTDIQTIT